MSKPSFAQRFLLAFSSYFRILFDAEFAGRVLLAGGADRSLPREPELPPDAKSEAEPARMPGATTPAPNLAPQPLASTTPGQGARGRASSDAPTAVEGALQLLSLLQRQGRFVDFIQQDVLEFSDGEIGQAARVVHEGCRATFGQYLELEPVLSEEEGSTVRIKGGFDARAIKLMGNVRGDAPYQGVLRHRGWRATRLDLPETLNEHAFEILAPAEVEI